MKNKIFAEQLKSYLEFLKESKGYSTAGEAIETLCEEIQKRIPGSEAVSRRAVYSWLEGEKYPSVERLLAIADILGLSLDALLKDRAAGLNALNRLPPWYEGLSAFSKDTLRRALRGYATAETHRDNFFLPWYDGKFFASKKNISEVTTDDVNRAIDAWGAAYYVDFYFPSDETDEDIQVRTDRFFTRDELLEKEFARSDKKLKKLLLERYLQKHGKEIGEDGFAEELLRVIDIDYKEERFCPPNWYDEELWIEEKDGQRILITTEDNKTKAWNEVSYSFSWEAEEGLFNYYKYNMTANRYKEFLKETESQVECAKAQFQELYECGAFSFGPSEFVRVRFYDGEWEDGGNLYCGIRVKLELAEEVVKKILSDCLLRETENNVRIVCERKKDIQESAKRLFARRNKND